MTERPSEGFFDSLDPKTRRMVNSVMAGLEHRDDRIPVYLNYDEIDVALSALSVMRDFIEYTRTGKMSDYLLGAYYGDDGPNEPTMRMVIDGELEENNKAFIPLRKAQLEHPAYVERRKHLRGEYEEDSE